MRGDADNAEHGDEGEDANEEEEFGQRRGAVVWNGHLVLLFYAVVCACFDIC